MTPIDASHGDRHRSVCRRWDVHGTALEALALFLESL